MPTVSLYIHWPFCLSKCPYCDFNSHVAHHLDEDAWASALCTELTTLAGRFSEGTRLQSIYFGGGTPSLMPPSLTAQLIQKSVQIFLPVQPLEVTLEANPNTFDKSRFQAFKDAGVNRLSLGIQSFDDDALKFLGRTHDKAQALRALTCAQDIFPKSTFDLIYGLPAQTPAAWDAQLKEAASFSPNHISCYQLTYEPGTAFYPRFIRKELAYPNEEKALVFDQMTEEFWGNRGLHRYEVSNYARPGFESQHNLAYWHNRPTLGIGPGAHGRPILNTVPHAERTHRAPQIWLQQVRSKGHGLKESKPLAPQERFEEWLMMGLRTSQGVTLSDCFALTGSAFPAWGKEQKIRTLMQEGFLQAGQKKENSAPLQGKATPLPSTLRTTSAGRLRLNTVLAFLLDEDDASKKAEKEDRPRATVK